MIKRLKLLQSKYSLSDEFMVKAIRSEIERQALLDINGAINNCSITLLSDMINSFSDTPVVAPTVSSVDLVAEPAVVSEPILTSVVKSKAKRRG